LPIKQVKTQNIERTVSNQLPAAFLLIPRAASEVHTFSSAMQNTFSDGSMEINSQTREGEFQATVHFRIVETTFI
jgi:hypothetical protein